MLTENHYRYLLNAFRHLDTLLSDAADKLIATDSHRLFLPYRQDATAAQQKILRDYLESLRFVLQRFMQRHAMVVPAPTVSTLKVFHTSLTFARIAVEELRPEYLRGYGELESADEAQVLQVIAELSALLQRIAGYLQSDDSGDLSARLARLESTRDEVQLLRELETIIDRHGLIEFRGALTELVTRMESPRYDIAFFGPVSAGKSSLLNMIVGKPVLPIGVTPITSVVTRLCYGDTARMRVSFASEPALDTSIDQVAQYVTERMNPSNSKHVVDVRLEVPSDLLHHGLNLIDTPGLGSLAAAGTAQTLAYLPRCDLGVMLVDATGRLAREDLAVARSVVDAGSELLIVLSKADLLTDTDRQIQVRYVQEQFQDALGLGLAVTPISSAELHQAMTMQWIAQELSPRLQRLRDLTTVSLRRKIAVLRESVVASLQAYTGAGSTSSKDAKPLRDCADRLAKLRADIGTGHREMDDLCFTLGARSDVLVDRAATSAAPDPHDRISAATAEIVRSLSEVVEALHQQLEALRARAIDTLGYAQALSGNAKAAEIALPMPSDCPLFDPGKLLSTCNVSEPFWTVRFPALKRWWFRHELHLRWDAMVRESVMAYSAALRRWLREYLNELTQHIDVDAAAFESRLRIASVDGRTNDETLNADLARLSQWPAGH